jgi:hypothetical protein
MTATQTITIPTESSPQSPAGRPAPPRRRRLLAAGLVVLVATVGALTVWLLTTSSPSQPGPITPVSAAAPQQQAAPAPDQANAGSKAGSVDSSGGYAQFCQNSPVLCSAPAAQAPPAAAGYVQFCQNSPTLCTAVVPERPAAGYVQFCQNSPVLCTKPN